MCSTSVRIGRWNCLIVNLHALDKRVYNETYPRGLELVSLKSGACAQISRTCRHDQVRLEGTDA